MSTLHTKQCQVWSTDWGKSHRSSPWCVDPSSLRLSISSTMVKWMTFILSVWSPTLMLVRVTLIPIFFIRRFKVNHRQVESNEHQGPLPMSNQAPISLPSIWDKIAHGDDVCLNHSRTLPLVSHVHLFFEPDCWHWSWHIVHCLWLRWHCWVHVFRTLFWTLLRSSDMGACIWWSRPHHSTMLCTILRPLCLGNTWREGTSESTKKTKGQ